MDIFFQSNNKKNNPLKILLKKKKKKKKNFETISIYKEFFFYFKIWKFSE